MALKSIMMDLTEAEYWRICGDVELSYNIKNMDWAVVLES